MTPTKNLTNADVAEAFTEAAARAATRRHAHLDLYRIIDASLTKSYADYPDYPFDLAHATAIKTIIDKMPDDLVLELRKFFRERFLKS